MFADPSDPTRQKYKNCIQCRPTVTRVLPDDSLLSSSPQHLSPQQTSIQSPPLQSLLRLKQCSKCHANQPLSEYKATRGDRLVLRCQQCRGAKRKRSPLREILPRGVDSQDTPRTAAVRQDIVIMQRLHRPKRRRHEEASQATSNLDEMIHRRHSLPDPSQHPLELHSALQRSSQISEMRPSPLQPWHSSREQSFSTGATAPHGGSS